MSDDLRVHSRIQGISPGIDRFVLDDVEIILNHVVKLGPISPGIPDTGIAFSINKKENQKSYGRVDGNASPVAHENLASGPRGCCNSLIKTLAAIAMCRKGASWQ